MGAGIFITAVVLGTVIMVSKMPYKIGKLTIILQKKRSGVQI